MGEVYKCKAVITSLTYSIKEEPKRGLSAFNRVTAANESIQLDLNITTFLDIN